MEEVIEPDAQGDAAKKDQEEIKEQYLCRKKTLETLSSEYIPPFQSFICPIKGNDYVMVDPVSLCTGTTCDRDAIETFFKDGGITDPSTGVPLDNLSLMPNHHVRRSIEEWRELNYCLKIKSLEKKLQSGLDEEALSQIQEIIKENPINKDWISVEGLIDTCISILRRSNNRDIKRRVLIMLHATIEGHAGNKERMVTESSQGIEYIVPCLGDSNTSKFAIELLFELLHDGSGWNISASKKLSKQSMVINSLVRLRDTDSKGKAESILLKLCDDNDDNIIHSAKANWFKPLVNRLGQGPETSRKSLVKALDDMKLDGQNLKCLGEEGVIPFLVEMVSRDFERITALSVLVKLSNCHENRKIIADAGGVSIVVDQMFAPRPPTSIIKMCSEVLERLSSNDDGVKFFVDANGDSLDLEHIVISLLAIQRNARSSNIVQNPSLRALLNIFKSEPKLVEMPKVSATSVPAILPLLNDSDQEIREIAINLLFLFSQHKPQGIVEFLLGQRVLQALVGFLKDNSRSNAQMAAAGLLANLPKSEKALMEKLIESDVLQEILNILSRGNTEATENALVALFRFTENNIEAQKKVVGLGAYPSLVNFLKCGSVTAKANAAALIGNLSSSTPKLSIMSKPPSKMPWKSRGPSTSKCKAHRGICSVKDTFCLLQANALPALVRLLHEHVNETAYKVLQALSTLVGGDNSHEGAKVLHEDKAISPVLEILDWGEPSLKEEALDLLEKVFETRELAQSYGSHARPCLLTLIKKNNQENDKIERKANRVLTQIDRYSRASTSLVQ